MEASNLARQIHFALNSEACGFYEGGDKCATCEEDIQPLLESYALSREQSAWAQAIERAAQWCEQQTGDFARYFTAENAAAVIRSLQPIPNWLAEHDKQVAAKARVETRWDEHRILCMGCARCAQLEREASQGSRG